MNRPKILLAAGVLALPLMATPGQAQPHPVSASQQKVQSRIQTWLDSPGLQALTRRPMEPAPTAPVTVRLRARTDLARLLAMEGEAIEVKELAGRPLAYGDVVCVRVTRAGLAQLGRQPWVLRVELDVAPRPTPPLARTVAEVGAPAVWSLSDADGLPLTGSGVTVADLDTHLDVFHPALFRADGGYHAWIDADGDGDFSPGVDGIDLDGDGILSDPERLALLDVSGHQLLGSEAAVESQTGVFEAGWDYLYQEQTGNGERDFGRAAFYGDSDPAFGEPIFAADDVDGDGRLDPDEKLVALGTSKVRAVFDGERTFLRGNDLSALPAHPLSWHGTCVTGILAGGTPGLTRYTGVAPDVELIFAIDAVPGLTIGGLTDRLIWAIDQGADVVLQELALLTMTQLDGSTNHERVMDQAAAAGVVMINPAGNAGGAGKAGAATLPAFGQVNLPVQVPPTILGQAPQIFRLAVHWREPGRALRFGLTAPDGQAIDLGAAGGRPTLADGTTQIRADVDISPRGTALFTIQVYGYTLSGGLQPVPAGSWSLSVSDDPDAPQDATAIQLMAFASDDLSGWGRGVTFPAHETEDHLIGFPATADSAITVAAYAGRDDPGFELGEAADVHRPVQEEAGQLRAYSSRGPRMDGLSIIDLAAPDNPLAPVSRHSLDDGTVYGHGDMMVFGGTSGAGPHVAGAAALLKQLEPDLTGLAVRDRLRQAALVDGGVTGDGLHAVADLWGAGKLRIYPALFGEQPAPNKGPRVLTRSLSARPGVETELLLDLSDDQDRAADLQVWWDDDYDGAWDAGPLPGDQARRLLFAAAGRRVCKVRVIDSGGLASQALVVIDVSGEGAGGCASASGSRLPAAESFALLAWILIWSVRRRRPAALSKGCGASRGGTAGPGPGAGRVSRRRRSRSRR